MIIGLKGIKLSSNVVQNSQLSYINNNLVLGLLYLMIIGKKKCKINIKCGKKYSIIL